MSITLEAAAELLGRPVLQNPPFPDAITGRCEAALGRFTGFAEALRSKVESDLERLQVGSGPEDWELAALSHALHEWRIYEAFRRLHEEHWCPGLLFRLSTKTDLVTLCDREADSSADGFTERRRKVLAKRGIDHRFKWREARRMVAAMGLLELPHAAAEGTSLGSTGGAVPLSNPEEADASANEAPAGAANDNGGAEVLPALRLDAVWERLPSFTKAQLEAVYKRMECGLWTQFGDRFYSSFKKNEMLTYVRRLVRFHANLEAVQHLSDAQVDALCDWMHGRLGERFQRDDDLRIAARIYGDLFSVEKHGRLSADAWTRYRDAEIRRIGAFCYHLFLEEKTGS